MKRNATFPTPAIPPLDLTPTGRLPYTARPADDLSAAVLEILPAAVDTALRHVAPEQYTPELAARITQGAVAHLLAEPAGPCPVFRDCTFAEPGHFDHFSRAEVTDTDGSPLLDVGMAALDDDHAVVFVRGAEFTDAASLKAKTAELRRLLDQADALADRVFADHEARG
ncbi:hypothetical protein AB0D90_15635 [Streptomyces althioticus]|uniref:hypothetical protein n=1 Tax=Streptomyces althioticus TaxID=83380 RepID=UPI0033E8EA8F